MHYLSIRHITEQRNPSVGSRKNAGLAAKFLQRILPWKRVSHPMLRHVERGLMETRGDSQTREE